MWLRSWGVGYNGLYIRAMTRSALNKLGRGCRCMVSLSRCFKVIVTSKDLGLDPYGPGYSLSDRSSGDAVENYRPSRRSRAESLSRSSRPA